MNKNQASSVCPSGHAILSENIFSGVFKVAMALLLIGSIILPLKASPPCGITANASGTAPSSCSACDGSATVNASGGTAPYTYLWSTGATTQSIGGSPSGGTHRCIDAGNIIAAYTYSNGDIFTIDSFYTPATSTTVTPGTVVYSCSNAVDILGTIDDDAMFRNERNIAIAGGTMTYNIPVINGSYDVELYFAELFYGVTGGNMTPPFTGKRKFDVSIEGVQVLNDYDIVADVGPATAVIKTFTTTVTDGTVTIDFTSVLNRAKVNGICIKPHAQISAGQGLCAGEYSVTVTDATGCTGIGAVTLAPNCDDNNLCTTDACSGAECAHTLIDCNDNNACTDDFCAAETGCYSLPHECNDADLCTDNLCDNTSGCYYPTLTCSDGDNCTDDFCNLGTGCYTTPVNCDDADACTIDACDSGIAATRVIDYCTHTPIDCDDHDACTDDACASGSCTHTEIPGCNNRCKDVVCNDEDDCTTDACDNGDCIYTEIICNDNELCTQDACIAGDCFYFADDCNDADDCTNDICLGSGFCDYIAIVCNDNNPCTSDACDGGLCSFTDIICNDNDPCTTNACDNGRCVYTPIICNDNNPCTSETCVSGNCIPTNNTASCNDNNACTNNDVCSGGTCTGTPVICNDNNPCTTETCVSGNCIPTNNTASCNDNNACTNNDVCSGGTCTGTTAICNDNNPCTSETCVSGNCIPTNNTSSCNDNNACTNNDVCSGGTCTGTQVVCNDNNPCTTNACVSGQCVYTPITCNDNDDCTTDACDAGICSSIPIVCNDGDPCTTDNCVSGRCSFKPITCDDHNACTTDVCNGGTCSNTPLDCNDNIACTQDACNNGICGHINICNPCSLEVLSFTLVNSLSDLDISLLENGSVINLYYTPDVNVRANLCVEPIGSVKFNLNGPTFKIENTAPYALAGDNPSGDYNKWNVSVGTHTLIAIPYPGASATGTQGVSKTITFTVINQQIGCLSNADCNDSDACTADVCQSAQCSHSIINCNDNNLCTTDVCNNGCINTPITCDDSNPCTTNGCNSLSGCEFASIQGCCLSAADCNDNDICTTDACTSNVCSHEAIPNQPSYLHVVNTAKSWKKLKLGYSATNLFTPKKNVTAGGNNTMCVTLRGNAATDWSRVQIRPQGSISSPVSLGSYGLGTSFTEICIPLSAFGAGVDFTQLTLIEIPFSNGAAAFEIDIQKIEFRGGATPFLWFGGAKTDNKHDGGTTSSLIATLVPGSPCGASKMAGVNEIPSLDKNTFLNAYPNPFNEKLNIEFSLPSDSYVKVEIFNLAGQRIAELFEGNMKGGVLQKIEFTPETASESVFIYRLQTKQHIYIGKAVLVK